MKSQSQVEWIHAKNSCSDSPQRHQICGFIRDFCSDFEIVSTPHFTSCITIGSNLHSPSAVAATSLIYILCAFFHHSIVWAFKRFFLKCTFHFPTHNQHLLTPIFHFQFTTKKGTSMKEIKSERNMREILKIKQSEREKNENVFTFLSFAGLLTFPISYNINNANHHN